MSKEIADWLINISKMQKSNGLFSDGISPPDCVADNHEYWTYNQGIFLDSFVHLSHISGNMTYINVAMTTLKGVLDPGNNLVDHSFTLLEN